MAYNFNINTALNAVSRNGMTNAANISPTDFVNRANDSSLVQKSGIVDTLYVVNDAVYAIVRKNYGYETDLAGDQTDHGDGYFNNNDGTPLTELTLAELTILTNINPMNNVLSRFLGKPCRVTVKNGVAIHAEVDLGSEFFAKVSATVIRKIRLSLPDANLFSEEGKKQLTMVGYTNDQISELAQLKYTTDQSEKIVTFENEAVWNKDTSKQKDGELILKGLPLINGLNSLGMKSKNCHIPSRIFSGK